MCSAIVAKAYPAVIFPGDPRSKDRFGIPMLLPSLLELDHQRRERAEAIEKIARDLFQTVVRHFGVRAARRLFREVAKAPPSGKQANEGLHYQLLQIYDAELARGRHSKKSLPGIIAKELKKKFGNSPEAREKTIRRLLKKRERKEQELDALMRRAEKIFGRAPESLLSKAKSTRTQQP
jgi:hypothetical protein